MNCDRGLENAACLIHGTHGTTSKTEKINLKAQQPKKKKVQCISFIGFKSHSAICNDDKG